MVSPELLRRYQFFAGLKPDHLTTLAKNADELYVAAGDYLFREGDELDRFYLLTEGEISILIELREKQQEIITSTIRPVEVFAWTALIPPHQSTAAAKAESDSRVVGFDCEALRAIFAEDHEFAYLLTQRAAQGYRERLRDMRIETMALYVQPS